VVGRYHYSTHQNHLGSCMSVLPLPRHAVHCCNYSNAVEHAGTGRRHACHYTSYRPLSTAPSSLLEAAPVNHHASTLEVTPVRAQGAPQRCDWSKIRQDGRQLHDTVRHAVTRSEIVWHACKSPSPWPIKGRRSPPPPQGHQATGSSQSYALRFPHDIGTRLNHIPWDLGATPPLPPRL
jgi:hypothetical protein